MINSRVRKKTRDISHVYSEQYDWLNGCGRLFLNVPKTYSILVQWPKSICLFLISNKILYSPFQYRQNQFGLWTDGNHLDSYFGAVTPPRWSFVVKSKFWSTLRIRSRIRCNIIISIMILWTVRVYFLCAVHVRPP